ncbi:hypothetical protein [Methylocystis bryophila]|uniref:Thiaminase-2/PQQC domain-containing protein n=1 Tax=Methylocystis bryophila TaxID=655015 RepID=A0A1W6MWD6_9HYPH|nr:hypothetical protein [Methylocystis bryophila]ARN81875.1 hypothetical protein B1812_13155 [Methylocystis bryophila]BDV37954.1 hypothetical protein DSM21852_12070 [Methylocystis bryophila]
MKAIFSYIEEKRKEYECHPFFTQLLANPDLPGEKRLAWAPITIPFIMGYADLNCLFRRNEIADPADPLQAILNSHTYEEDFHWQWFLNDLNRHHANPTLPLADAVRILWSDDFKHSRTLSLELCALALRSPSYVLFVMMEVMEATSMTVFKNCVGIKLQNGDECEFFGTKHYLAEASHAIYSLDETK